MSAQLDGVFDPNQVAPIQGGGNSLPISDKNGHIVIITESENKMTKDGTGMMLALTLQVQGGAHNGAEGTFNLNLGNSNAIAVRIAQTELSCICHAVGYLQPLQNTEPLHNKPFRVVVELQKGTEAVEKGYTQVTKILRVDGSKPSDKPGSAAPQVAPAPQQQMAPPQAQFPQPQQPAPAQFPQAAPQAPPAQFPINNTVQPQQPAPVQQMAPPQAPPQQVWQQPQQPQPQQQMAPQAAPQQAPPQQVPWGQPPTQ